MIDLGDIYRITVRVADPGGVATDPQSSTLVVTLPDGSTQQVDVVEVPDKPGWVYGDFLTTMAGRHSYTLSTETPTTAYRDVFDVYELDTTSLIVSLAETKAQLNLVGNGDDDEIRGYIQAATNVVHHYVGPSAVQRYTERHSGTVILNFNPVIEIESIEVIRGRAYSPADVEADVNGQLWGPNGEAISGTYRITYRAGHEIVPANRTRAAMLIIQHMWETQRTNDIRRPPAAHVDEFNPQDSYGRSFSIPRRAVELLESDMIGGVS